MQCYNMLENFHAILLQFIPFYFIHQSNLFPSPSQENKNKGFSSFYLPTFFSLYISTVRCSEGSYCRLNGASNLIQSIASVVYSTQFGLKIVLSIQCFTKKKPKIYPFHCTKILFTNHLILVFLLLFSFNFLQETKINFQKLFFQTPRVTILFFVFCFQFLVFENYAYKYLFHFLNFLLCYLIFIIVF